MRRFDECEGAAFWADPAATFARLFAEGDRVLRAPDGALCLFGHRCLTDFARHPVIDAPAVTEGNEGLPGPLARFLGAGLFAQSGEAHRRQRRAALAGLGTAPVAAHGPVIERIVRDRLAGGAPFDLGTDLAIPITADVWTLFVGYPPDAAGRLADTAGVLADPAASLAAQIAAAETVTAMTADLRLQGSSAFIDAIEAADDGDGFDAVPLVASMVVDGIDSAAAGIGGALSVLAAQSDDSLTRFGAAPCLEEALRLWMPVVLSMRQTTADVAIGDVRVARGTVLWMWWGAGGHDPAAFSEPGAFRPGRGGPLAPVFGGGRHACLGHALVRRIALSLLGALKAADRVLVASSAPAPCAPWRLARLPRQSVRLEVRR